LTLGMGAGWQEREHHNYGWDLLDVKSRLDRLEEGLEVVTRLMRSDEPVSYKGQYYTLDQAILLPRPQRPGGPHLLIGGNGEKRTLPLAAQYADEWNGVFLTPEQAVELNNRLDDLLVANNRQPGDLRRSMMTGLVFGRTEKEFQESLRYTSALFGEESPDELHNWGMIIGRPAEIKEQIQRYQEAGIQRLMLQWLNLDDIVGLEALGQVLL
jgi:alkanesulfonate monooxygenase SsuD/methylene tetrahydromethanopterin reductase-like flavin-dependent oxidoreductase (luciferase family)